MSYRLFSFRSANGRDDVQAFAYYPYRPVKGTVQFVHGFLSHQGEFMHLFDCYLQAGYAVYADDHVGHGRTAAANGTWGDFGSGGSANFAQDERTLFAVARDEFPGVPHLMHGFSMGTQIIRDYLMRWPEGVAGVLLEGVVQGMASLDRRIDDPAWAQAVADGRGAEAGWDWVAQVFEGGAERFAGQENPDDFGTTDAYAAQVRGADPYRCETHVMTKAGVREFVQLQKPLARADWADGIPAALPFLLFSGDQDPCCNYGEGLYRLANELVASGHRNVTVRAFTGCRHALTTDPSVQEQAIAAALNFADAVVDGMQDFRGMRL